MRAAANEPEKQSVEARLRKQQRKVLELLDASGAQLHRLLARLTLREDIVGDLLQELFIRLSESSAFDKAADPVAYACRAAINLAFEWRRKQKPGLQLTQQDCLTTGNRSSPLGEAIAAEELERVLDATSQLSDLAREVIVLRYIEQHSYEEIAARLGKKPQHMRSLCAKATARLRKLLKSESDKLA